MKAKPTRTVRKSRPTAAVKAAPSFDLLLKGGRVIDPANGLDAIRDIGIKNGRIAAIEPAIPRRKAAALRDASGLLVLPGLIDTHAHIFEHVAGDFGLNPDDVGTHSGVTTVVDQGGPSALTINGFRKFIAERADTKVMCFISAYLAGGLHGHRFVNLYGPSGIDVNAVVTEGRRNRDMVRGIKVHAEPGGYSRWGMESLKLAKEASRKLGIPVYIHLGTLWPEARGAAKVDPALIIAELEPLLDEGDILAHPFTRHPSGFVSAEGEVHPVVFKALERGVRLDVGHGSHFSFRTAKAVVEAGITPFTLGADLHGYNVGKAFSNGGTWQSDGDGPAPSEGEARAAAAITYKPTFSLYTAMSEMLALGIPEIEVIKMVTVNAAEMLGMTDELGTLGIGRTADISVIELARGRFTLKDASGVEVKARHRFRPVFALRRGRVVEPDSPLIPPSERPRPEARH